MGANRGRRRGENACPTMPSDPLAAQTAGIIERARRIRLVVSDCDGVLTDGGVYYSGAGEVSKRFHIRDGMGVERLRKLAGIDTALVSGEGSPAIRKRAEKLSITECHLGIEERPRYYRPSPRVAASRLRPSPTSGTTSTISRPWRWRAYPPAPAMPSQMSGRRPISCAPPMAGRGIPGDRGDPHRGRDAAARLIQRGASCEGRPTRCWGPSCGWRPSARFSSGAQRRPAAIGFYNAPRSSSGPYSDISASCSARMLSNSG